ncbi:MAG: hypothetical protein ACI8P3_000394 [Saprospiraceae bacterium]|jgi:hypothetical protein
MKILNIILAVLFTLFAYFQLNDPDPFLWITIYLAVAAICAFAAFGKYNRWVIMIGLLGLSIYLGLLLPSFFTWVKDGMPTITASMKAESKYIELVREFLGLLILMGALVWQYFRMMKEQRIRN